MNERARQLDDAIDGAPATPLVDASTLDVAQLLQADAQDLGAMPNAAASRARLLEGIVELQVAELDAHRRSGRAKAPRRAVSLGRRIATHGMVAILACGASAALAQTDTPPGNAVRVAAREVAQVMHVPSPVAEPRDDDSSSAGPATEPTTGAASALTARQARLERIAEARKAQLERRRAMLEQRRQRREAMRLEQAERRAGDLGAAPSGDEPLSQPQPKPEGEFPPPDGTAPQPAPKPNLQPIRPPTEQPPPDGMAPAPGPVQPKPPIA